MYHNRIKCLPIGRAYIYLITNRITGGSFVIGEKEKQKLKDLIFNGEHKYGYEVWDYVIMDNHYHALIKVNDQNHMPRQQVLKTWQDHKKLTIDYDPGDDVLNEFRGQLHDISKIVSNFQQRFTQWFNKLNGRWGRLFGGRFDSVIVDENAALSRMSAYISLNAVRAGIVSDPAEYQWCGFGERMGKGCLRINDLEFIKCMTWNLGCPEGFLVGRQEEVQKKFWKHFRGFLLGHSVRWREVDVRTVRELLAKNKEPLNLAWEQRLMLKTSFVTKGGAIGSKQFVEGVISNNVGQVRGIGRREAVGTRLWDEFYTLKKHRQEIF